MVRKEDQRGGRGDHRAEPHGAWGRGRPLGSCDAPLLGLGTSHKPAPWPQWPSSLRSPLSAALSTVPDPALVAACLPATYLSPKKMVPVAPSAHGSLTS